jgi:hypothetical protein
VSTTHQLAGEEALNLSVVGVRFNPRQRRMIANGLHQMVVAYLTFKDSGSAHGFPFRVVHPLALPAQPWEGPGTFNGEFMQMILELWAQLKGVCHKRTRARLHFIQLSACILGLRIRMDFERVKLKKKHSIDDKRATKRVIKMLERQLKRARRLYAAEASEAEYKQTRIRWFSHLRWVRMNLVHFRRYRPKTQIRRVHKMIIDWGCDLVRAMLYLRDLEPPADLRKLVRLALRYVRRGRYNFTERVLRSSAGFAGEFLFDFIEERRELVPVTKGTINHNGR